MRFSQFKPGHILQYKYSSGKHTFTLEQYTGDSKVCKGSDIWSIKHSNHNELEFYINKYSVKDITILNRIVNMPKDKI